jgi:hypothetical protein
MVCHLPQSVLPSLWCKIQCIVGITVTQWLTICLPIVLMVESSSALSTFPEAGMMAQSRPTFCLIFIRRLAHTKCASIPRSGGALDVLVGPISRAQAYQVAPNLRPYLICLSNIYVSLRQASEWGMRGLQGTFP